MNAVESVRGEGERIPMMELLVAQGKVIVTDRQLKQGVAAPRNAFDRAKLPGSERVLCLDQKTGEPIWKVEYECDYGISYAAGPRCTI